MNEDRIKRISMQNIVQLQLTENKIYALSASGNIYVFAAKAIDQRKAVGAPTPSSDSWWSTGWLWGEEETIDFAQLHVNDSLNWKEKYVSQMLFQSVALTCIARFTSIAAGQDHLLALTSKGRAFGHPVTKKANAYGQLGFQKISVTDPASLKTGHNTHFHVDLVPKSLRDPFLKASRSIRAAPDTQPAQSDELSALDDTSVRFCPFVYEIPVLRGVDLSQIAAGARSSFARTPSGRVLGWGANEYGQLGLGANVALDTITIPTEVVLWRAVPNNVHTSCTDVTAGPYSLHSLC